TDRTGARRDLGRIARSRKGRRGGSFLRSGRPFAAGDAGDVAFARGFRHRDPSARSLRSADLGVARRAGRGCPADRQGAILATVGSGTTDRNPAAFVRPTAPLVSRSTGTGKSVLQHARGPA